MFNIKNPPNGYYVYVYLREDNTPYYVGKGSGPRAWVIHHNGKKGIRRPTCDSRIIIVSYGLTELWSLALERRLIRWYGRKDNETGILRNKTDGGDGACNVVMTDEKREMYRILSGPGIPRPYASRPGNLNTFFGKTHSDDTKKLQSEIKEGINNPMHGRKQNRCSCIGCKKETSVNVLKAYHKECR